jgi:serine/threonine protein kinase/tetratricopeptide (TPR) repeat protein
MPGPDAKSDRPEVQPAQTVSANEPQGGTQDFRPNTLKPGAPAPASSVVVPGYRILAVLGRGGMGVVYHAIQEKANRQVALKMILAGAHADEADHVRFRAEAEAAARLSHPNIVQLFEVGETPEGFPYFSLEYVAGGTLAERLKNGPMKAIEAAAFMEALARAMQYAHEHDIVHRDLKPANILMSGEGRVASGEINAVETVNAHKRSGDSALVTHHSSLATIPKISDFGLAKQLDNEDGLTRTGAIMGTPSYMAPEQAFGKSKDVGPAADIYALGAILYECLTGRPPFKGASVADTLEQVRTMEPITVRAFIKEIPRDLETICLHCLHKDPARRYLSAEALADDLRRYREGQPITVRPVGNAERVWRWCKRNPGWAAMIAAVAVSLLTVIGVLGGAYATVSKANFDLAEENKARKKAEEEAKENEKLAAEHADIVMDALGQIVHDFQNDLKDVPGSKHIRDKLLKEALTQMAKLKDSPATSSRILRRHMLAHMRMAEIAYSLGDRDRAMEENRIALDYARKAMKDNPTSDKNKANLYSAILVKAHDERYLKNEKDAALEAFHTARRGLEEMVARLKDNPDGDPALEKEERCPLVQLELDLALSFEFIASWHANTDQAERAKWATKAMELRERIVARVPTSETRSKLAASYQTMAGVTLSADNPVQSLDYGKKQLNELKVLYKENPNRFRLKKELAMSYYGVHRALWSLGRQMEAIDIYREGIPILEQVMAADPTEKVYSTLCAEMLYAAGCAHLKAGDPKQAHLHFDKALELREKAFNQAETNKSPATQVPRAYYMLSLARCGDHVRAAQHAEIYFKLGRPGRDNLADVYGATYAMCYGAVAPGKTPDQLTPEEKKLREQYLNRAMDGF